MLRKGNALFKLNFALVKSATADWHTKALNLCSENRQMLDVLLPARSYALSTSVPPTIDWKVFWFVLRFPVVDIQWLLEVGRLAIVVWQTPQLQYSTLNQVVCCMENAEPECCFLASVA